MADISKIKTPDNELYNIKDSSAVASITRSGTTFTATKRDGTTFTFTQQDNNTTYTIATGDSNGQIKVTPSSGDAYNVSVKGLAAGAYKAVDTTVTSGSSNLITSGAVYIAIDNLPEPMIFKGSLGTGGTITTLPTASSANEGYTYKVITAGTYASQAAKVGDLFISNGTDWIWIPSGDEPSGTVTSITLKATSPIAIDSSSAITTSGTRTLSHANSGVTAGTYRSVTVNATGHVTTGTNPTTLSGYGITDAKIANGVITLGSNTITPLTSHQTVTDNNPTLAWGTKSKVATIGSTAINVTMPSNPNTDTKVTAVDNHYTPAEDSTAQLDADASSTTVATWNSTSLVTGITVKRDAKGHVTGIAVDSIKMPANPNTNTTYTIGTSGNNITLTPSSGSVQSITAPYATDAGYLRDSVTATAKLRYINSTDITTWTADTLAATDSIAVMRGSVTGAPTTSHAVWFNVKTIGTKCQYYLPDNGHYIYKRWYNNSSGAWNEWTKMSAGYADSAGSATKATQDGSGNTITSTYVKKSGDTMTGTLTLYKEGTTNDNYPTELKFQNKDTTTGKTSNGYIRAYDGGESGANIVINPAGNMFIGSGEAAQHHYDLYTHNTGETFYATSDYNMYLQANGQTIANRVGVGIYTDHSIRPIEADASVDNVGSIGTADYKWANGYFTNINGVAVGDSPKFTDTNNAVKQTVTTANANYEVLFSVTADNTTRTEGARKNSNFTFNPSTGELYVEGFKRIDLTGKTVDLNDFTLSSGAPHIMKYIEKTDGGASNISNRPITATKPFILDVELIRWASTSDYQTRQTYRDYNNSSKEYVRFCANGTWSAWTTRVFTDNNTTYTLGTSGDNITLTPSSGSAQSITAPYANSTKKLENYYDSRPTDCNLLLGDGSLRTFQATSSMTSNKPPIGDAHIIHLAWDNTGGYDGQIALKNSGAAMMCRAQSSKTWGSWMPIGVFTQATPTTGQVVVTDGTVGGIKSSGYTIAKSVPSDAKFTDTNTTYSFGSSTDTVSIRGSASESNNYSIDLTLTQENVITALGYTPPTANTDVNVKVNNTNPTTGTWYYPVWYTGTSGTGNVNANDGLRHYSLQGTASTVGRSILSLGNVTSTGTAGNKRGELFLYSEKSGRAEIVYTAAATATVVHTFPATAGTILNTGTTSFTQTLASGTEIGTIKINGTSTKIYCQTNTDTHRPIYIDGTEILGNNTTTFNLRSGSNITLTHESAGTVTIAGTANNAVTQTPTTTDAEYEILFSHTADNGTRTEGARKTSTLKYNPNSNMLTVGEGIELGMASASTVPHIDFHWNSINTDYTARLIQRVENTIDFLGKDSGTWGTARAASFSSQSSIFVKENIYSITDDEAKRLLQLRPVAFDYKGDGLKNQRGLIAEEVANVMPEMVIAPKGYTEYDPIEPWNTPCIDYSKFVPYLIKMIQIQQKEIDELKSK